MWKEKTDSTNICHAHTIITTLKDTKFKMSKWFNNSTHNKHRDNLIKDTSSIPGGLEDTSQGRGQAGGHPKLGPTRLCSHGKDFTFSCKVLQSWGDFKYERVQTIWSCTTNITLHIVGVWSIADLGTPYQMQSKKWRVSSLSLFLLACF